MRLFEMKDWDLIVSDEAWGLKPFNKILKRDKSKNKELAIAEMTFIWFFSDIKSNYLEMDKEIRIEELKNDIQGLDENWEPDEVVWAAVDFYKDRSKSIIKKLYRDSVKSAEDIGDYLSNTKALLAERDLNGKPIYDVKKIADTVKLVPKLMADLRAAYKEVVKEQEDIENKHKGSRKFNTFENGL